MNFLFSQSDLIIAFLVTENLVVTGAHCVQNKQAPKAKPASYCNAVIGKHNLNSDDEEDYLVSSISNFIVHPSWKPKRSNYDGDIAILVLSNPIEYKFNIKPLCLPTKTENYNDIVGKSGILAGYDEKFDNELEIVTRHLKLNEVGIVSEDVCLESDTIFDSVLSHRTFCSDSKTNSDNLKGK